MCIYTTTFFRCLMASQIVAVLSLYLGYFKTYQLSVVSADTESLVYNSFCHLYSFSNTQNEKSRYKNYICVLNELYSLIQDYGKI